MRFTNTPLPGACVVDIEPRPDERGVFARTFCEREFAANGLTKRFKQCNLSVNSRRGVLRGMHFQAAPHGEAKLVRCVRGAVYDVIVDLRSASPTFLQWFAVELTARNARALYVPDGLAHGFVTLEDDTELLYLMSEEYHANSARVVRWNDPAFSIDWPIKNPTLSARDATAPDFVT